MQISTRIAMAIGLGLSALPAFAEGPAIYSHTIERTHSKSACMQRVAAIIGARQYESIGGSNAAWMSSKNGSMSFSIRCDISGITLFIASGPDPKIRELLSSLMMDYQTIQLGQ